MIVMEETQAGRYGQCTFASDCFWLTKKARFSAVVSLRGQGGVAVVWSAEIVVIQQLRIRRGSEDRKVAFVPYIQVTAPLNGVEKNLGSFCVR